MMSIFRKYVVTPILKMFAANRNFWIRFASSIFFILDLIVFGSKEVFSLSPIVDFSGDFERWYRSL